MAEKQANTRAGFERRLKHLERQFVMEDKYIDWARPSILDFGFWIV
jgi:hypothetical protein